MHSVRQALRVALSKIGFCVISRQAWASGSDNLVLKSPPVMFLELKVPPVAVTLIFGLGMWIVATYTPAFSLFIPWRFGVAIAFVVLGATIASLAIVTFRRASTTVNPLAPTEASTLVKTGVYGISRNPMYLGLLLALTGWAIVLSNLLAVLFLIGFVAYMSRFQITPEERALLDRFGSDFIEYKKTARRWL